MWGYRAGDGLDCGLEFNVPAGLPPDIRRHLTVLRHANRLPPDAKVLETARDMHWGDIKEPQAYLKVMDVSTVILAYSNEVRHLCSDSVLRHELCLHESLEFS
jgi:hypothetical protein